MAPRATRLPWNTDGRRLHAQPRQQRQTWRQLRRLHPRRCHLWRPAALPPVQCRGQWHRRPGRPPWRGRQPQDSFQLPAQQPAQQSTMTAEQPQRLMQCKHQQAAGHRIMRLCHRHSSQPPHRGCAPCSRHLRTRRSGCARPWRRPCSTARRRRARRLQPPPQRPMPQHSRRRLGHPDEPHWQPIQRPDWEHKPTSEQVQAGDDLEQETISERQFIEEAQLLTCGKVAVPIFRHERSGLQLKRKFV